jgi:hypothetical protein
MCEARRVVDLTLEPHPRKVVERNQWPKDLDGDVSIQHSIPAEEDACHAASA